MARLGVADRRAGGGGRPGGCRGGAGRSAVGGGAGQDRAPRPRPGVRQHRDLKPGVARSAHERCRADVDRRRTRGVANGCRVDRSGRSPASFPRRGRRSRPTARSLPSGGKGSSATVVAGERVRRDPATRLGVAGPGGPRRREPRRRRRRDPARRTCARSFVRAQRSSSRAAPTADLSLRRDPTARGASTATRRFGRIASSTRRAPATCSWRLFSRRAFDPARGRADRSAVRSPAGGRGRVARRRAARSRRRPDTRCGSPAHGRVGVPDGRDGLTAGRIRTTTSLAPSLPCRSRTDPRRAPRVSPQSSEPSQEVGLEGWLGPADPPPPLRGSQAPGCRFERPDRVAEAVLAELCQLDRGHHAEPAAVSPPAPTTPRTRPRYRPSRRRTCARSRQIRSWLHGAANACGRSSEGRRHRAGVPAPRSRPGTRADHHSPVVSRIARRAGNGHRRLRPGPGSAPGPRQPRSRTSRQPSASS